MPEQAEYDPEVYTGRIDYLRKFFKGEIIRPRNPKDSRLVRIADILIGIPLNLISLPSVLIALAADELPYLEKTGTFSNGKPRFQLNSRRWLNDIPIEF